MKINIAKSSGFCFGVKRAIDISKALAKKNSKTCVLGDIVHNSFVVNDLNKIGIKKIKRITPSENTALIIRAHGAPITTFEKAKKCGYKIVDATCPKVKEIYTIARKLEKKRTIIIIGDINHDEVKGIAGQLKNKAITIDAPENIPVLKVKKLKKVAVVTQSTQTLENISNIMDKLQKLIPDVELFNTTCRTTIIKQQEIMSLPKKNDVMLIIGSTTSANTKRLFEISKQINKKTYWIENSKNIKKIWFKNVKNVGIMAGASTPDYVTNEVVEKLKELP